MENRRESLEERLANASYMFSQCYLVKVTNKFPRVNGLPLIGEWTLQEAGNGNLHNSLNPFRWKTLNEVEKYIETRE